MREHAQRSMRNTMERLKPYFRMRKAYGKTFYRSERKQKQQGIDSMRVN
jgi:hypothetical protein